MFNLYTQFTELNLNSLKKQVKKINNLESETSILTEIEIKEEILKLIKTYKSEKKFELILEKSFALTREASKRTNSIW
jgi:preprotein translocase subunit SecA